MSLRGVKESVRKVRRPGMGMGAQGRAYLYRWERLHGRSQRKGEAKDPREGNGMLKQAGRLGANTAHRDRPPLPLKGASMAGVTN